MAKLKVNGVEIFYESSGTGEIPIVLVHGSWVSHRDWNSLVPYLAESFRVITYDRRGHSQSERPEGQGSVREDVSDLAALIEHLGPSPAWVVGNSFGGSITLRLAAEHSALLRGVMVHEPPLFSLLNDDPNLEPVLEDTFRGVIGVLEKIDTGNLSGAAEQFVDSVALGPGSWAQIPSDARQSFIQNAPTFLDEAQDPEQLTIDLEKLKAFSGPVLLSKGGQSPGLFAPVVERLGKVLEDAEIVTFPDAGHIPHVTHPDVYADAVKTFIGRKSG